MMFLFCFFLLLLIFTFAWDMSLRLYPNLSTASWYWVRKSLKISSEEDNLESRDLIEIGSCLIVDGGWLDSIFVYFI